MYWNDFGKTKPAHFNQASTDPHHSEMNMIVRTFESRFCSGYRFVTPPLFWEFKDTWDCALRSPKHTNNVDYHWHRVEKMFLSPYMTKLQLSLSEHASVKEALYSHKRKKDNYTNVRYLSLTRM